MLNAPTDHQNKKLNNLSEDDALFDISELWLVIRQSWHLMAAIMLLTILSALVLAFVTPKKWEATATLQVGRTPVNMGDYRLIEDPMQTLERLKLRQFKTDILSKLGLPLEANEDDRSDLILSTLQGNVIKGTEFINLSVRGYSSRDAANALQAAAAEIQAQHALITDPVKKRLSDQQAEVTRKLDESTSDLRHTKETLAAAGAYSAKSAFPPSIIAINLLTSQEKEIRELQTQKDQYDTMLAVFSEQSTKVINKIYVSKNAVFPKTSVFLSIGFILGALLALATALLRYQKHNVR